MYWATLGYAWWEWKNSKVRLKWYEYTGRVNIRRIAGVKLWNINRQWFETPEDDVMRLSETEQAVCDDNDGVRFQLQSRATLDTSCHLFDCTVIKHKYVLLSPRCCQLHSACRMGNAPCRCFLSKLRQSSTHFHLPYNQLTGAEFFLKSWDLFGYSSNLVISCFFWRWWWWWW